MLTFNQQAMELLHSDHLTEALHLLLQAETHIQALPPSTAVLKMKSVTFNNLGCFYKRVGQLQKALEYLYFALDIDANSVTDRTNLAGTHLNICAIMSQTGQHREALKHALEALQLLQGPEASTTRVIAHHNAAVELEYLALTQQAVEMYKAGIQAGKECLDPEHPLLTSLQKCYYAALSKIERPGEKKRFASVTPVPAKSTGFQKTRKPPRRSASKDTYGSKPNSSPNDRTVYSRSFDEREGWLGTLVSEEHRRKARPKPRRAAPGLQLLPLGVTAPFPSSTLSVPTHSQAPIHLRPALLTLGEKLHKRPFQVVNILSTEVSPWKSQLYLAFRIHQSRKTLFKPQSNGRKDVEKRAQAAIQALEQLKKVAAAETWRPVLPRPPISGLKVGFGRAKKGKVSRLDTIPEAIADSGARVVVILKVQTWFRSMLIQHGYRKQLRSILRLQAWVRMVQTRRLYVSIVSAVQLIQAWWRLTSAGTRI